MKAIKRKAAAALVSVVFLAPANAQFYKDMSVGLNAGAWIYQGDLTPQRFGSFKTPAFGWGLFAKKPINSFLAFRFNINIARLRGDESLYKTPDYRQQRNFSFTTPVKEFSGLFVWNILGRNYDDYGFMPYVFAGSGLSFVRITPNYSRMNTTIFPEGSYVANGLTADIAHGTPRTLKVIPVGLGVEKSISNRFSVSLESSYRFIFTDYLDGFSQSANPNLKDHYHSTTVGLIYKFGNNGGGNNGVGCPVMKY